MIFPPAPVMLPVPVNGSHCAAAEAAPLPTTELAPTKVPLPVPLIEEMVTSPLLMRSAALPV